jgi:hypothetical protein
VERKTVRFPAAKFPAADIGIGSQREFRREAEGFSKRSVRIRSAARFPKRPIQQPQQQRP